MRISATALGTIGIMLGVWWSHSTSAVEAKLGQGTKNTVCVVGGGPSGVAAAKALEGKGYSVTLFEKENVLGGRTVPFKDINGEDMIRHIFISNFEFVHQLATELGVSANPIAPNRYFYLQSGQLVPTAAMGGLTPAHVQAITTYESKMTDELVELLGNANHDDIPAELMVPFREWLVANAGTNTTLSLIEPLMYTYTTNFGYGFASSVPAVYYLKYFLKDGVRSGLTLNWQTFPYHELVQKFAGSLQDVRLNSEVEEIQIQNQVQLIKVKGVTSGTTCSKTILAFPPSKEALEKVKYSLDDPEVSALLNQVEVVKYHELVIQVPDEVSNLIPSRSSSAKFFDPVDSSSVPNVYLRPHANGRIIALLNGGSGDTRTQEDIFQLVKTHMQTIFGVTITKENVVGYKGHPYFPHVSSDAMADGFYDSFEQIVQGHNNVFFLSGLQDFELVDSVMRAATDLVNKYF